MTQEIAIKEFRNQSKKERGVITISMWECDCSGHPYRLYGYSSYLIDGNNAVDISGDVDVSGICLPKVTTTSYYGEILPHVVVFEEIW